MRNIVKLGLILFIVTAVSAGALSLTNNVTKGIIEEKAAEANKVYMQEILPDADDFNLVEDPGISSVKEVEEVYEALKGGEIHAYVIKTKTKGYGGDVIILTGVNIDGTIAGIRVASQSETPNLGDKITGEEFCSQFIGKSTANELSLDGDIDGLTGATVSSRAAINGVNASIRLFESVLK